MARKGKRFTAALENLDRNALYTIEDAVKILKDNAKAKFDETIEVAMNLGVDPRHADQMVRGTVSLPHGTGKALKVAVFAKDAKADEAREAGADFVGAEDLMEQVQGGMMDFDRCIATPDMMGIVGRLGKVLGPKGLMPNPKLGTVTPDVAKAVEEFKGGKAEYRTDRYGNVHVPIGKTSFEPDALTDADLDGMRAMIERRGIDASGFTDDQLRDFVKMRGEWFRDNAPTTADEAAAVILGGVREGVWRILIGDDARILDEHVRATPEDAYEQSFMQRQVEAGGIGLNL